MRQRRTLTEPRVLGRAMRKIGADEFQLKHANWVLSVFRIGSGRTLWTFSIRGPALNGGLLSDRDFDSAERAAAELENLLTNLAIAVVTRTRPTPAKKKAKRRQ